MNIYFLRVALPNSIFKFNSDQNILIQDFFLNKKFIGLSIDSRNVGKNEIFLAIEGTRVDGHNFLIQALKNGANVLIIKKEKEFLLNTIPQKLINNKLIILVDNTLNALFQLAKNWRQRFNYPVVGITGSIGKTTTKQMLKHILLQAKKKVLVTFKNQNTNVGLSLNILKMCEDHEVAIFELGINDKGEMDELVDILRPDIALITRVANSHTFGLDNIKGIINEKKKIFKFFKANNIAIVCGDQPLLVENCSQYPLITFGLKGINNIQARTIKNSENQFYSFDNNLDTIQLSFVLKIFAKRYEINLKQNHQGFVLNALAASSIAYVLDIAPSFIIKGLESFSAVEGRFEQLIMKDNRGIIINDSYNASPESMKAAITAFSKIKVDGLKIAILGDMLELGKREIYWHRQVGRFLNKILDLDLLILVGSLSKHIQKTAPLKINSFVVPDWEKALDLLNNVFQKNNNKKSVILFKASFSMALNKIVDKLT